MRLRTKLVLAFMAFSLLLAGVGGVSLVLHKRVEADVVELHATGASRLGDLDLLQSSVEAEGYWDRRGTFVATHIEALPQVRRPKLRGAIQARDAGGRQLTLYGVPIRITEDTVFEAGPQARSALSVGQRIELSARVERGRWFARRIATEGVKESDKIKGTPTRVDLDGRGSESLDIHGITIALAQARHEDALGGLHRLRTASQMTLALQSLRAAALDLLGRPGSQAHTFESEFDRDARRSTSPEARIRSSARDFSFFLDRSRPARAQPHDAVPFESWLDALERGAGSLDEQVDELLRLAERDRPGAARHFDTSLDLLLQQQLLPLLAAYRREAEEALSAKLGSVTLLTEASSRLALAAALLSVLLALALGWLLWRSIRNPIRDLEQAARRLGRGELGAQVKVRSRDELGVLSESFNRMARDLAASTVSLANLESVFDSMSCALVVLDAQGRITRANAASRDMLGHPAQPLEGSAFAGYLAPEEGSALAREGAELGAGPATVEEKHFRRADGSLLPVSFCNAPIRRDGAIRGYVCVAQDLSDRKHAEEQIRRSLREKELLLRELRHRVNNNMQLMTSLLSLQGQQAQDAQAREQIAQCQARIHTIALINEQLHRSADLSEIDLASYLQLLGSHILRSFDAKPVEIQVEVEEIPIDVDRAFTCGLIVNELVTNALKHAFPHGEGGTIRVSLRRTGPGRLELVVSDDGLGLDDETVSEGEAGIGLTLVEQLAEHLGGAVERSGDPQTRVCVWFPHSGENPGVAA